MSTEESGWYSYRYELRLQHQHPALRASCGGLPYVPTCAMRDSPSPRPPHSKQTEHSQMDKGPVAHLPSFIDRPPASSVQRQQQHLRLAVLFAQTRPEIVIYGVFLFLFWFIRSRVLARKTATRVACQPTSLPPSLPPLPPADHAGGPLLQGYVHRSIDQSRSSRSPILPDHSANLYNKQQYETRSAKMRIPISGQANGCGNSTSGVKITRFS